MYYGMMWLAAYEDRAVGNKYVQVTTGTVVSQVLSPCECCRVASGTMMVLMATMDCLWKM
jgi:hypothetical protein